MSRSNQESLYEGWLTKSPPSRLIWRGRWRRRWFSLQCGEIPGQYILVYYTDRNCRKVKGIIDLEHCEQVDTGFKFDEGKLKLDYLFDIKTPQRTYYLAADTETEMKAWVKNICGVCNLKPTVDEEDVFGLTSQVPYANTLNHNSQSENVPVLKLDITNNGRHNAVSTSSVNSISPTNVSTSPYIPISECITGKSPLKPGERITHFQALLQHNLRNSYMRNETQANNQMYETAPPTYHNFMVDHDPRSYDLPRLLQPPSKSTLPRPDKKLEKNSSPLQSPTDSESVFTDDDWSHSTLQTSHGASNPRPSESSTDGEFSKYGKSPAEDHGKFGEAPPRPPKPSNIACYLNLPLPRDSMNRNDSQSSEHREETHGGINDEMYDFPRSHQGDPADIVKNTLARRHCYNNAAPGTLEGQIFRYDMSPKPGTSSSQIFRYDLDESQEEPASPLSQSSSTPAYSNLPSPLLPDCKLMPPPIVNRGLKPKRKTSDTISVTSTNEPSSPRGAPSVDRTLKPSKTLPANSTKWSRERGHVRKWSEPNHVTLPKNFKRSYESLLSENEQIYFPLSPTGHGTRKDYYKLEYLDLDLDNITSNINNMTIQQPLRSPGAGTVYQKVDFQKTEAFNITRNNLEKERKETIPMLKK